jgi:hypothetical protein
VDLAIFGLHLSGVSSLLGAMNLSYKIFVTIWKDSLKFRFQFKKCYSNYNKPESNFKNSGGKDPSFAKTSRENVVFSPPKKNKKILPKLDNK